MWWTEGACFYDDLSDHDYLLDFRELKRMWEPAPNELDTESEQQLLRAPNKIINLQQAKSKHSGVRMKPSQ